MSKIICTADWHLCKSVPPCRKETEDEWFNFQFEVVRSIFQIAREYNACVCCAGDLFDRSVPGTRIVNTLLDIIKEYSDVPFFASAGNHETPYHNHKLLIDSAFETIFKSTAKNPDIAIHHFNGPVPVSGEVVLCHHLCFPDAESIPYNVEALTPESLSNMYPDFPVVICGDYHGLHSHFIKERQQYIIVPGCTTIQTADYLNYSPSVLFIDTETLHNQVISLPNNTEMLSREHLDKLQTRNEHIDKFINMLASKENVSLSFSDNLKVKISDKDIPFQVKTIIKTIQERVHGN